MLSRYVLIIVRNNEKRKPNKTISHYKDCSFIISDASLYKMCILSEKSIQSYKGFNIPYVKIRKCSKGNLQKLLSDQFRFIKLQIP